MLLNDYPSPGSKVCFDWLSLDNNFLELIWIFSLSGTLVTSVIVIGNKEHFNGTLITLFSFSFLAGNALI